MNKESYVLRDAFGNSVAVILAADETELRTKLETAIKEEVSADADGQFELEIGELGDWGEDTPIKTKYVYDGLLVTDDGFSVVKTISY